jgi:hypothetical protein
VSFGVSRGGDTAAEQAADKVGFSYQGMPSPLAEKPTNACTTVEEWPFRAAYVAFNPCGLQPWWSWLERWVAATEDDLAYVAVLFVAHEDEVVG